MNWIAALFWIIAGIMLLVRKNKDKHDIKDKDGVHNKHSKDKHHDKAEH